MRALGALCVIVLFIGAAIAFASIVSDLGVPAETRIVVRPVRFAELRRAQADEESRCPGYVATVASVIAGDEPCRIAQLAVARAREDPWDR